MFVDESVKRWPPELSSSVVRPQDDDDDDDESVDLHAASHPASVLAQPAFLKTLTLLGWFGVSTYSQEPQASLFGTTL